jgi:molybdenum cofactor guanylyltransferase
MGTDKGLISFHGKPQREHLHILLSSFCSQVFLSCKTAQGIPEHLHPLPDKYHLHGPLNGILSAFEHNRSAAWLTVPVDMPMIDETIIRYLLSERDTTQFATCFVDSDGAKPEPLFVIWEPQAFADLKKFQAAGEFSPRKFLMEHPVKMVTPPSHDFYENINTPEALEAFLNRKR